jgi:small subunit ribosomal protein S6e
MRNLEPGERKRKLVRGNLITEEIYQLNCQLIDAKLPEKEQLAAAAADAVAENTTS